MKYHLLSRCCHSAFSVSKDIGKELENGKNTINPDDIIPQGQLQYFNCHN